MKFNKHYELKDRHCIFSPSKYSWVNYDLNKLEERYIKHNATMKGTQLHEFAAEAIKLNIKLQKSKKTLNMYINDAIGFLMFPEVSLYYSENFFGTADAISFNKNILRIHDLKTGTTKVSFCQLEIYTALFCLEYNIKIDNIQTELRVYQNDNISIHVPEVSIIKHIIDKIILFDKHINKIKLGE